MKYVDVQVVFREVPDEITLAINISGCPVHCPGCHSSYLAQDIGTPLTEESLEGLLAKSPGVTCVSFMGGDADPSYIRTLALSVRAVHPELRICWYSGRGLDDAAPVLDALDYLKVGPYVKELGPLDWETTNQRFYRVNREAGEVSVEDITPVFRRKLM